MPSSTPWHINTRVNLNIIIHAIRYRQAEPKAEPAGTWEDIALIISTAGLV